MKCFFVLSSFLFSMLFIFTPVSAQEDIIVSPTVSQAAEGLDLQSVAELFRESENLEQFEQWLNDPEIGVNNLDLDNNFDVDYIRVIDESDGDVHFIVLQVPLGYEDFQDVAVIEVIRIDENNYEMELRGDEDIYGPGYYYTPTIVHIHKWAIIPWIYSYNYNPYRSAYFWGSYPVWWKPYRTVQKNIYHTRVVHYKTRSAFSFSKTRVIKKTHNVKYVPRKSKVVKKRTVPLNRPDNKPRKFKETKTRTVKKSGKAVKPKTGVKKGNKKTVTKKRK